MTEPAFHYLFQAEKPEEKLSRRRNPAASSEGENEKLMWNSMRSWAKSSQSKPGGGLTGAVKQLIWDIFVVPALWPRSGESCLSEVLGWQLSWDHWGSPRTSCWCWRLKEDRRSSSKIGKHIYDPSMSKVHVKNGFLNLRQERDSERSLLTPSGKVKHMQFFGLVKWWSPKKYLVISLKHKTRF